MLLIAHAASDSTLPAARPGVLQCPRTPGKREQGSLQGCAWQNDRGEHAAAVSGE